MRSVIIPGVAVPCGAFESLPAGRAEYTNTLMAATATLRLIAFQLAGLIETNSYSVMIVPAEGAS